MTPDKLDIAGRGDEPHRGADRAVPNDQRTAPSWRKPSASGLATAIVGD